MITRDNFKDLYPLSPLQEGMLYEALKGTVSAPHWEQIAWRLCGPLDPEIFRKAWVMLVERHDALRTVIVAEKTARPVQVVLRQVEPNFQIVDLSPFDTDSQQRRLESYRASDRANPADILGPHLVRVALFILAPRRHVVVLSFHHILLDGWSLNLLLGDLVALYGALKAGLAPLAVDWPNYGRFIRHVEALDRESGRRFWAERLTGAPALSPISPVRPRRDGGATPIDVTRRLNAERAQALFDLARRLQVSPSVLLQALWGLLLMRHNDETRALFAMVVSGRDGAALEAERLVGLCINTVPVAVAAELGDSLADFVRRVHREAAEAVAWHQVPLTESQPNPNALYSLFVYENYPRGDGLRSLGIEDLAVESVESIEEVPYPVTLVVVPGDGLTLILKIDPRHHDRSEAEAILDRFERLIEEAVTRPEAPVAEIEMLTKAERAEIESFGRRKAPFDEEATIDDLFTRMVALKSEALALRDGDVSLTYGALDERAGAIAAMLASSVDAVAGSRVAVLLDRSADLVASFLGILRAGGIYVPIDPGLPTERIRFMIEDSAPVAVIAPAEMLARLALPTETARIAREELMARRTMAPVSPARRSADDAAYLIYTSGSTGQPKGALVAHRGAVNLFPQLGRLVEMGLGGSFAMFHSPSFDASILEMLTPLLNGGAVEIAGREIVADPQAFGAFLRRTRPRAALVTPAYLRLLDPHDVGVLNNLISGGEAAEAEVLARYCGRMRVINAYGPSETSVAASFHLLAEPVAQGEAVPIGRPFDNVEIQILDQRGQPVPVGAMGEIHIGGAALGLGYLGRPDLTAARFVPHPFKAHARLYRSGDFGRWRPDGTIDYLGRSDDQVKIRGFRLELGEIQARLAGCPGVREAYVLVREIAPAERILQGFVSGSAELDPETLRAVLRQSLPDYAVPTAIFRLDALPLTPSGKIDRRALIAAAGSVAVIPPALLPKDELEAALLAIWREVLHDPALTPDRRFLEAGGHSLAAMRILMRVRRDLKRPLSLSEFFSNETVAALATLLRGRGEGAVNAIPPAEEAEEMALSHAQRRLWFLNQWSDNPATYTISGAFKLEGALDRPALERALKALTERHESLRIIFPIFDGEPRQKILPTLDLRPEWRDFSDHPAPEAQALYAAQLLAATPFDLACGPLIRVGLFALAPRCHLMAFAMHHIVSDGWSAEILAKDLSRLYACASKNVPFDLPPLPVRFRDVVQWLNQCSTADQARQFWRDILAEPPPALDLQTDFPRPLALSHQGGEVRFRMEASLLNRLAALGGPGTTAFMALVALVKTLLHRYTGQTDIAIGHPIAGRDHADLELQVGCFVNTLVLRDRFSPDWSFRRLTEMVRRNALAAFEHRQLSFDLLIEELALPRTLNHNPFFDVMVLFEPAPVETPSWSDLSITRIDLPATIAKFDLTFEVRASEDALEGRIGFSRDLFLPETIERMASHLERLAWGALAEPDLPIARLPLLSEEERHQQLAVWNPAEDHPDPGLGLLHEVFARRAAEAPDAVAIAWDGEEMTYGAVDRASNRLARRLQGLGIGPEMTIGLAAPRSFHLLIGILGILKAGAAYVPLDPIYPDKRLAFIAETAGVSLILASATQAKRLAGLGRILELEEDDQTFSDGPVVSGISLDSLAYVMFTSGSTGEPKGVAITHRNVARLFTSIQSWFHFGPQDRFSLFHSYAFDVSVFEIWGAWLHGGRVVVVPLDVARAPDEFLALLRSQRITILSQTPSAFLPLIDADGREGEESASGLALRCVLFAGETLDLRALKPWVARHGDRAPRLINLYGITETTIHDTYYEVLSADCDQPSSPIGVAFPDTRLLLLDPQRQLLPVGAVGEIHIGGPALARGYFRRPELTAERFIADPFDPEGRRRLYRSGDLARYRPDGTLEYHGRIDHQVKIRGFRVELGEIEGRLAAHPAVKACAVVARPLAGHLTLIAHVALRAPTDAENLLKPLRADLPDYMVPALVMIHERLPLNGNGKIDRTALPEPDERLLARARPQRALETETERALAGLWAEVLDRREIGREDDFFALGGHSLNAAKTIARINDRFALSLKVRVLFEHPVLADLARAVEETMLTGLNEFELTEVLAAGGEAAE